MPEPSQTPLPSPPSGTKWVERGYNWTNSGVPVVHCIKAGRRVIPSKVALVPAGGIANYFWEAVPVDDTGTFREVLKTDSVDTGSGVNPDYVDAPKEEIHKPGEPPVTEKPGRTIEVVRAIPEPGEPEVPASDPAFDAAWAAWRRSPQGIANTNVRGLDISRLWTIMEARIKASFEAGWEARK
jgi:hypothetical protein